LLAGVSNDVKVGNVLSYGPLVTPAVAGQQLHGSVSTGNALYMAVRGGLKAMPTVVDRQFRSCVDVQDGSKAAHFQYSISTQPFEIKRHGFHENVQGVDDNKHSQMQFYAAHGCTNTMN